MITKEELARLRQENYTPPPEDCPGNRNCDYTFLLSERTRNRACEICIRDSNKEN